MRHKVVFAPEARDDLIALYKFIAVNAGPARALAYLERIEDYCLRFDLFPARGTSRDGLFPGLRLIGFETRVAIAFLVGERQVTILRVLYGERDIAGLLGGVG